MKKEITVTGKNYGYVIEQGELETHWLHTHTTTSKLANPYIFLSYLDGRPCKIALEEQFGWEDGCRNHPKSVYQNPRYIADKSYHGDASSLSKIVLEVDWSEEDQALERELEAAIPF